MSFPGASRLFGAGSPPWRRDRYYGRRGRARLTDPASPAFSPARSGGRISGVDEGKSDPRAGAKCEPATPEIRELSRQTREAADGRRPAEAERKNRTMAQAVGPSGGLTQGHLARHAVESPRPGNNWGPRPSTFDLSHCGDSRAAGRGPLASSAQRRSRSHLAAAAALFTFPVWAGGLGTVSYGRPLWHTVALWLAGMSVASVVLGLVLLAVLVALDRPARRQARGFTPKAPDPERLELLRRLEKTAKRGRR